MEIKCSAKIPDTRERMEFIHTFVATYATWYSVQDGTVRMVYKGGDKVLGEKIVRRFSTFPDHQVQVNL